VCSQSLLLKLNDIYCCAYSLPAILAFLPILSNELLDISVLLTHYS
jgi:hypothetical protein